MEGVCVCVYLCLIRLKSLTREVCSGIFRMSSQSFSADRQTDTQTDRQTDIHTHTVDTHCQSITWYSVYISHREGNP